MKKQRTLDSLFREASVITVVMYLMIYFAGEHFVSALGGNLSDRVNQECEFKIGFFTKDWPEYCDCKPSIDVEQNARRINN